LRLLLLLSHAVVTYCTSAVDGSAVCPVSALQVRVSLIAQRPNSNVSGPCKLIEQVDIVVDHADLLKSNDVVKSVKTGSSLLGLAS
jgi:hypothetical protein